MEGEKSWELIIFRKVRTLKGVEHLVNKLISVTSDCLLSLA